MTDAGQPTSSRRWVYLVLVGLGILAVGWVLLNGSVSARIIRKLSLAGVPLPGLFHAPQTNTSDVFLTFDDGPSPALTPHVLDVLAAHGAKATFFVIGERVEKYPQIVERIHREGHALANHTFTHPALTNLSVTAALDEVDHCQRNLAPWGAGQLFRPPHGLLAARVFVALVRHGYRIVFWTQDSGDWQSRPEAEVAARLVARVHGGDIVLFHDDQPNSIRIFEAFLTGTANQHFHFVSLPGAAP